MKQITVYHSKTKIFNALEKAVGNLEFEIKLKKLIDGRLVFYSSGGLFSFGNKIYVSIKPSGINKHILKVESISSAVIQVIDWGTNSEIEKNVIEEVIKLLS